MKTPHASAPSNRFTAIHWFTTVLGVAIAVACSFILAGDFEPDEVKSPVSGFRIATVKGLTSDFAHKVILETSTLTHSVGF
jgi:hypothetical protein